MAAFSCALNGNADFLCTEANSISCADRSMVLGVKCRTHNENVELEINRTISVLKQCCPNTLCTTSYGQMIMNIVNDSNSSSETIVNNQNLLQSQVSNERVEDCVSTPVLGGVVGVLVTVLVVLVIGWSLSCVALVKRNSHTQKQAE